MNLFVLTPKENQRRKLEGTYKNLLIQIGFDNGLSFILKSKD